MRNIQKDLTECTGVKDISFVDKLKGCKSRGKAINVQISRLIHSSEKGGKFADRE